MAYTSDKKPGSLNAATSLAGTNNLVVDQSGTVVKATLNQLEAQMFAAKTQVTPVNGDVVVVRRGSAIRQVVVENMLPTGSVTNAMLGGSIADSKLNTISTAGKIVNSATTATDDNTANAIVARDGSGNFTAGTITASLSGNASTATTAATATKLATGRTIAMTGDVTYTSPAFDGTANVTAGATLANSGVAAGTYNNSATEVRPFTVDAKGRITEIRTSVTIKPNYSNIVDTPYKNGVVVASTANLPVTQSGSVLTSSSTGALVVDGYTLTEGQRILLKDQTNNSQNGIYEATDVGSVSTPWVLTRTTDANQSYEVAGALVTVDRGSVNGGLLFTTNFKSSSVINTAEQNWYRVVTTGDSKTVSTAMIDSGAVDNTKLRNSAALSVIGRSANSSGDPADIAAGTDGHVLRRSGTALGFGQIVEAGIADNAVTNNKFRNSVGLSVIGRSASTTGGVADIAAATDGHVLRRSGSAIGFGQIVEAGIANNAVTTAKIPNGDVTFEKLTLPSNFPIQVVQAVKTDTQIVSETGDVWEDITGLSLTLTRRIASSSGAVRIQASIHNSSDNGYYGVFFRILRGSTAIGVANAAGDRIQATAVSHYPYSVIGMTTTTIDFIDNAPGSTLTVTYKVQARTWSTVDGYINRSNNDTDAENYTRAISTLTLTELTP